jgi:hypothetical protein
MLYWENVVKKSTVKIIAVSDIAAKVIIICWYCLAVGTKANG